MMQLFDWHELPNRQIRACKCVGGEAILTFEDGSYIYLTVRNQEQISPVAYINYDATWFEDQELIDLGIVTFEELRNHKVEQKKYIEESERETLARLKAKYETP